MNQQSITTPANKTVSLKYTLPYIIYNLTYFNKYIIFIYSHTIYILNLPLLLVPYHLLYSNTITPTYYSYFQIRIHLLYFELHGEHVTNLNNECAHLFSWILFLQVILNI